MQKNNDLEYMQVGRIKLTEKSLNDIIYKIESKYDLKVVSVEETKDGYIFKGKYGFTIGDVAYNEHSGTYSPFNFHKGVIESVQAKDEEIKRKKSANRRRQYKIQRNIKIGIAFTAAGIIALTSLGVIKNHNDKVSQSNVPSTEATAQVSHLNTLKSADDLILLEWANYAIAGLSTECADSQYEAVQSIKDDAYANMFVPIMTSYYNYLDMIDSGLPLDIVGESISNNHNTFRANAEQFDSFLSDKYFSQFAFDNSPYADAVVMNQSGEVLSTEGKEQGELKDEAGQIVTYDSDTAKVYVRATSIPGQSFTLDNLPDDAILYNGDAYVLASHLYDGLNNGMSK